MCAWTCVISGRHTSSYNELIAAIKDVTGRSWSQHYKPFAGGLVEFVKSHPEAFYWDSTLTRVELLSTFSPGAAHREGVIVNSANSSGGTSDITPKTHASHVSWTESLFSTPTHTEKDADSNTSEPVSMAHIKAPTKENEIVNSADQTADIFLDVALDRSLGQSQGISAGIASWRDKAATETDDVDHDGSESESPENIESGALSSQPERSNMSLGAIESPLSVNKRVPIDADALFAGDDNLPPGAVNSDVLSNAAEDRARKKKGRQATIYKMCDRFMSEYSEAAEIAGINELLPWIMFGEAASTHMVLKAEARHFRLGSDESCGLGTSDPAFDVSQSSTKAPIEQMERLNYSGFNISDVTHAPTAIESSEHLSSSSSLDAAVTAAFEALSVGKSGLLHTFEAQLQAVSKPFSASESDGDSWKKHGGKSHRKHRTQRKEPKKSETSSVLAIPSAESAVSSGVASTRGAPSASVAVALTKDEVPDDRLAVSIEELTREVRRVNGTSGVALAEGSTEGSAARLPLTGRMGRGSRVLVLGVEGAGAQLLTFVLAQA